MTTQCPICRSSVDIDDAKAVDGAKTQCPLCDEVFLVRPLAGNGSASPSGGATSGAGKTTTPSSGSGNASRKLLEEDVEGASPRVLVAHDSHAFGDVVRGLLEEEGFDVEVVHDGDEALKVIVDRPPLIAILEAGLPKKFGFQLCAEVRALPDPPSVRFLLVASIYDRKRFAKQPTLANAPDDFVEPRNLEIELLPKVRRLLRGRNDGTASRSVAAAGTAARRVSDAPPPVIAPAVVRPAEPNSVSRSAVGEDDFKDLFEDSDFQNTGSGAKAPPAEAETPIVLRDVDDLLKTGSGPALDLSDSSSASSAKAASDDDDDDLLANMLEDSDAGAAAENTSEDPPDAKSSRESDDDELLRTLMQMASSDGVEPSKPSLEDDEVLPEGSDEVKASRIESDEDSLLGGILEDDGVAVPRDEPRDEPTGRAPREGPMDLPSTSSVPEVWKQDAEDAKRASETDADELEKLLGGDRAAMAVPTRSAPEPKPDSKPKVAPPPVMSGGDDVIRMSEFEMDAPPPRREQPKDEPHVSNGGGFELDGGDDLKAAMEMDGGLGESRSPSGVMPASGSAGTPTVLKGPAGGKGKVTGSIDGEPDFDAAVPSSAAASGNSFSSTESISGDDDDEKSLAEAKVPMDDELDRLLGGSPPRAPENMATKPGLGPRPLPADDIATGRTPAAPASNGASSEHEKAKRLAKLIVGDILLYNADRILDAVKTGTFFEVMKGDIKDGRDFYDGKVPEGIRRERDYIQEVLEEVLENKRKELGLA